MEIKTKIYSMRPMQFVNIILHLQLKRYRYVAVAVAILLVVLPIIKLHYIYASIIVLFGTVPFIIFHLYFSALTQIKISPFADKYILIEDNKLTVVPTMGDVKEFARSDIKYMGYNSGYYILSTPDKGLLMVSAEAFNDESERNKFLKTYATN
ncbi:MAG: hypothetical protein IKV14_01050 [Muribaculaceae bacterium]|nr:hypothetical protein [Muribaculaceae bacterium]